MKTNFRTHCRKTRILTLKKTVFTKLNELPAGVSPKITVPCVGWDEPFLNNDEVDAEAEDALNTAPKKSCNYKPNIIIKFFNLRPLAPDPKL